MRIGIVSDTHRNSELLDKVVHWLVHRQHISTLYHLGDDFDDVTTLADQFSEVVQVPGVYDERYRNGTLPAKIFETILGINILLIHSIDKDLCTEDISRSDIILHGHTHRNELRLDDGKLFFNPGHLKGKLDKNMPPSFGILDIQDREVVASIYDLKFQPVHKMDMIRSESGLYRGN
jgi:uncharacterized protein